MVIRKIVNGLSLLLLIVSLSACGGGGGSSPDVQEALVRLSLDSVSQTLGSVYLELDLPLGFTFEATGGELADGVVTSNVSSSYIDSAYQPEAGADQGHLKLALISSSNTGFNQISLFTITRPILATDPLPAESEFVVTDITVTDINGVKVAGYSPGSVVVTVLRR